MLNFNYKKAIEYDMLLDCNVNEVIAKRISNIQHLSQRFSTLFFCDPELLKTNITATQINLSERILKQHKIAMYLLTFICLKQVFKNVAQYAL